MAHGAWRCQSQRCKPAEDIAGLGGRSNLAGMRNAPDAKKCEFCGTPPPPSEEAPSPNPPAETPGLLIVTGDNFEELVVRSPGHFFLLVRAPRSNS